MAGLNKTKLAHNLNIARSSLYYKPKRESLDLELQKQIKVVLATHPAYGHKRIALELQLNKKSILRVMKKYSIKPYRRRARKPVKKEDLGKPAVARGNHIQYTCPIAPNVVWVSDFTYIKHQGRFVYLATVMDLFTREVIGWNCSSRHDQPLVRGALVHALQRRDRAPLYIHSDQGSEYTSASYVALARAAGISISLSRKSSPWENPHQESFYSQFKVDLGYVERFEVTAELIEEIYATIYYYNTQRIHTSLKMSPLQYKQRYTANLLGVGV